MRHYIYCVEDKYTKEFYWGCRSCSCDPKDDPYMGSMKFWKPNKDNLVKTVIIEYPTREDANKAERIVVRFYIDKKKFPLNRNYNVGGKFCMFGASFSEEHKKKIAESHYGMKPSNETRRKLSDAWNHRTISDETKEKMREHMMGNVPWNKGKKAPQCAHNKHKKVEQLKSAQLF